MSHQSRTFLLEVLVYGRADALSGVRDTTVQTLLPRSAASRSGGKNRRSSQSPERTGISCRVLGDIHKDRRAGVEPQSLQSEAIK